MKPVGRRDVVRHLQSAYGVGERRACAATGFRRSSQRYRSRGDPQVELHLSLCDLAAVRVRYGYRRLHVLLRCDRAMLAIDIALDVAFHAGHGAELSGDTEIADRLGAQRRGIELVLQLLTRAGIVESIRGAKGSYRLARAPRAIPFSEVVAAVTKEEELPAPSGQLATKVTEQLWGELAGALTDRLSALTLGELLRRTAAAGLAHPRREALDFAI